MEAEMTIVSEESRELADTLEEREVELLLKVRTVSGTKSRIPRKNVNCFDPCRILTVVKEAQQYFGIPTYMHKHRLSSCK